MNEDIKPNTKFEAEIDTNYANFLASKMCYTCEFYKWWPLVDINSVIYAYFYGCNHSVCRYSKSKSLCN